MRIVETRWTPYALPFSSAMRTAHGEFADRRGVILRLTTDDGRTGVGDAAPIEGFGMADAAECVRALEFVAPKLLGIELREVMLALDRFVTNERRFSALRFAFETAVLDVLAQAEGKSIARYLSPDAIDIVWANAVVDAGPVEEARQAAVRAVEAGYQVVKLKVGVERSNGEEIDRVVAVREAIGLGAVLRVDANGAWNAGRAIAILSVLEAVRVQIAEQPVPAGDFDGMRRVRESVAVHIAADESLIGLRAARRLVQADAADVFVIKPSVVGGLSTGHEIARIGVREGVESIVTSGFDSGIGVAAALHLAATLPAPAPACGLATLEHLEDDLIVESLSPKPGRMNVPEGPGLGVTLDEEALARYATGAERRVSA